MVNIPIIAEEENESALLEKSYVLKKSKAHRCSEKSFAKKGEVRTSTNGLPALFQEPPVNSLEASAIAADNTFWFGVLR